MVADWKDRIDGIKRIVLAVGVMSLSVIMSMQYKAQTAPVGPDMLQTRNAAYEKCAASVRETRLGIFGCAVVLKLKVKTSTIRFLSAERDDPDASSQTRPMFKTPDTP